MIYLARIFVLLVLLSAEVFACTTVLVSGRATTDGRPLLWKNRDTWQQQNEVLYDDGGKYALIGIVNAEAAKSIWMGANETGFCIENSLSKDLQGSNGVRGGMGNGSMIRLALETCANADEFEALLQRTNSPGRRTQGNFGVIDAQGNAVMFEVGPNDYLKFDANDPAVAPDGIIVRANTSVAGSGERETTFVANAPVLEKKYSGRRYCRARDVCLEQLKSGKLDLRFMLQKVARDIETIKQSESDSDALVDTARTLNRNTTVSAVVFQGVLPNESPAATTMWTLLGEPAFSIAVPNWVAQANVAQPLNGDGASSICKLSVQLREQNYQLSSQRSGDRMLAQHVARISKATLAVEDLTMDAVQQARVKLSADSSSQNLFWKLHQQAAQDAQAGLQHLCQVIKGPNRRTSAPEKLAADFRFDGPDGTKLADAKNSAGSEVFDGGLADCKIKAGKFRIRRDEDQSVNRFVDVTPNVRVSSDDQGSPKTHRGWIVMEVAGWNLSGDEKGEAVRIGFASQSAKDIHTVGLEIRRVDTDNVSVSGVGFGDGSTNVKARETWPAKQTEPVVFAIELDKVDGNNGESDSGGAYRLYVRRRGQTKFQPLGEAGKVRRLRNGNHLALHVEGNFGGKDEFFDIDRIYYSTTKP
ncbi:MAG: carcinine hydrolase/isopenicillin-N N-acyltransferase family protein [Pirellulaceae bacterium]